MRKPLLGVLVVLTAGCNPDDVVHRIGWFSSMRESPALRPYEQPIPPPAGAVPVTGGEVPVSLANADRLANARDRTSESLERGKLVYQTYCLVCHGEAGLGDGPISATAGGPFPAVASLVSAQARARSDGYLYGVIVDARGMGRGLMPRYGYMVRGDDRWDLVNYLRAMQALAAQGGSTTP